jgi:hypothetical protein
MTPPVGPAATGLPARISGPACGGASDAGRSRWPGAEALLANGHPALLASPVAAIIKPARGGADLGEMTASLIDQCRDVLPLERVGRALRVVLVVAGSRRCDNPVEVTHQRAEPGFGAGTFRGQPSTHPRSPCVALCHARSTPAALPGIPGPGRGRSAGPVRAGGAAVLRTPSPAFRRGGSPRA